MNNNQTPHVVRIHDVNIDQEYTQWLGEVKARYRNAQIKAAYKVHVEQLVFNWQMGRDLVLRKAEENGAPESWNRSVWICRRLFRDQRGSALRIFGE